MVARAILVLVPLALLLAACGSTAVPGPTASASAPQGSLIPVGDVHDITFVRPGSGWALGGLPTGTVVARSTDGGRRWHAWGAPLPSVTDSFEASLVVMLAGNGVGLNVVDGVVTVDGSPTVLVSTNRLMSWHTVRFPAPVLAVAADPGPGWSGGTPAGAPGVAAEPLWVLTGPLSTTESAAQAASPGPPGALLEALLYPASASWKPYGTLAGQSWAGRSSVSSAHFVRLSASNGYAVVAGTVADTSVPGGFRQVALVEQTTNYGSTWRQLPVPCGTLDSATPLSAVSLDDLWLGCSGEPGAGNQIKVVYRSINGGRSWEPVWDGSSQGMVKGMAPLSSGYLQAVVALSPADAYVGLGRGGLIHTADAGRTWRIVVPHIRGSGGVLQLDVLDATDAWALVGGGRLWATTNGRQWRQIAGPSS
ncbi:MAG: WD40/YVTN/BNR-like repeat-containing protein [Candidatus Dormibacteria bacterium]